MRFTAWSSLFLLIFSTDAATRSSDYLTFTSEYPAAYDVAGFETLTLLEVFRAFDREGKTQSFSSGGTSYVLVWNPATNAIQIMRSGKALIQFDLGKLVQKLRDRFGKRGQRVPQAELTLETSGKGVVARLYFDDISAESEEHLLVHHFRAQVFFRRDKVR